MRTLDWRAIGYRTPEVRAEWRCPEMSSETMPSQNPRESVSTRIPLSTVLPSAAAGTTAATIAIALDADIRTAIGIGIGIALLGGVRVRKTNIWRILAMRSSLWWRNRRGGGIEPSA